MVKHKISWRNAGEIPPGFLQEVLQLIMEKNEVCFYLYKHCTCITQKLSAKKVPDYTYLNYKSSLNHTTNGPVNAHLINIAHKKQILQKLNNLFKTLLLGPVISNPCYIEVKCSHTAKSIFDDHLASSMSRLHVYPKPCYSEQCCKEFEVNEAHSVMI